MTSLDSAIPSTGPINSSGLRKAQSASPHSPRLELAEPSPGLSTQEKAKEILRIAGEAFAQTGNWVVFYRELLGRDGAARKAFPRPEDFESFQRTKEHNELLEMVAALRSQDSSKGDSVEPERMITIRLPKSLHDVLTDESELANLSINKLCISKLLQPAEPRFVPIQQGRRRGRRPGPQGSRKKSDSSSSAS